LGFIAVGSSGLLGGGRKRNKHDNSSLFCRREDLNVCRISQADIAHCDCFDGEMLCNPSGYVRRELSI